MQSNTNTIFSFDFSFIFLSPALSITIAGYRNLSRTQDALRNLIESPQNNFRVFVNGSLIYCDANRIEDLQMMLASYFGKDAL